MFKLVALTALVANSSATPSAKLSAESSKLQGEASKYNSTPGSKIWSEVKKTGKYHFMAATKFDSDYTLTKDVKIEDLKDNCQACFMTGNTYTAKHVDATTKKTIDATCDVPAGSKSKGTDAAAVDYTLTYEDFITGAMKCAPPADDVCGAETYTAATFNAKAGIPTGVKGDKPFTWSYGFAKAAAEWDTCHYSITMPTVAGKNKWVGGLLLTHTLPASEDVQAVVQYTNTVAGKDVNMLYNSNTLHLLALGTTNKVVILGCNAIDVLFTAMTKQTGTSTFKVSFERQTTAQLGELILEHGGVIVWVIIGIVVFCLLCVGVIVWKKCFHKQENDFYLEDCYARV